MKNNCNIKILSNNAIDNIAILTQQLNPNKELSVLKAYLKEMFSYNNYYCFGLFMNNKLIGVSSGWETIKLYSGKQLELDNVVIDTEYRSKGYGQLFFKLIEEWVKKNYFNTIELNTYVKNSASHKFYFNNGMKIIGYHFQKEI